jgi:hypothetical protein
LCKVDQRCRTRRDARVPVRQHLDRRRRGRGDQKLRAVIEAGGFGVRLLQDTVAAARMGA